ncbi:hypothetical protein GCM10023152_22030 [Agromyces bauzanensis]|uniref:Uncharacterized protein n=1 Tax=Agromyces bauzanensis TaxID=1308924 RepID=A0A917PHN6_9MICO|nr:hypothetical protein GCM10011372_15970 [Agromyces bauzanensis]
MGAVFDVAFPLEPRAGVPEARPFDLVRAAMPTTLRPSTDSRRQDGASVSDQASRRTMVSRPCAVATIVKPSDR